MKTAFIIAAFIWLTGCASTMQVPNMSAVENPTYQEVIEVPGLSKQQIFERSKQWLARNFVSAKKVIEYENAEEGKIIGNGSATVTFTVISSLIGPQTSINPVGYTIIEDIKDGKARIAFDNVKMLNLYGTPYGEIYQDAWERLKPQLIDIGNGLRHYLQTKESKPDW